MIQEKIFHYYLKSIGVVSVEILKNVAKQCVQDTEIEEVQSLFESLPMYCKVFWSQLPCTIIKICMEWLCWLEIQLNTASAQISEEELQTEIWTAFLNRLRIEPTLLCNVKKNKASRGNSVLQLFVEAIEETIYTQFSVSDWSNVEHKGRITHNHSEKLSSLNKQSESDSREINDIDIRPQDKLLPGMTIQLRRPICTSDKESKPSNKNRY